jgi:hypothetical protein
MFHIFRAFLETQYTVQEGQVSVSQVEIPLCGPTADHLRSHSVYLERKYPFFLREAKGPSIFYEAFVSLESPAKESVRPTELIQLKTRSCLFFDSNRCMHSCTPYDPAFQVEGIADLEYLLYVLLGLDSSLPIYEFHLT